MSKSTYYLLLLCWFQFKVDSAVGIKKQNKNKQILLWHPEDINGLGFQVSTDSSALLQRWKPLKHLLFPPTLQLIFKGNTVQVNLWKVQRIHFLLTSLPLREVCHFVCLAESDHTQKQDLFAPVCVFSVPPQRFEEPAKSSTNKYIEKKKKVQKPTQGEGKSLQSVRKEEGDVLPWILE